METDSAVDALIDSARLLDLDIRAEWRAGVAVNVEVIVRMARMVMSDPVSDASEPAPVFVA